KAEIDVPEGGTLNLLDEIVESHDRYVMSYVDLPNGGVVRNHDFSDPDRVVPTPNDPMGTLQLYLAGPPGGTSQVVITASCFESTVYPVSTFISIDGYRGCAGRTTFDVVGRALSASGTMLGAAVIKALPFTPGQPAGYEFFWSAEMANVSAT